MAATLATLGDALVTALSAVVWVGGAFTVRRSYADVADEQMASADRYNPEVIVVMPTEYEDAELETRGQLARVATFTVVVRRRFDATELDSATGEVEAADLDELVELVELLSVEAVFDRLTGAEWAAFTDLDQPYIYRREHLRSFHQFTSEFDVTFEISAAL